MASNIEIVNLLSDLSKSVTLKDDVQYWGSSGLTEANFFSWWCASDATLKIGEQK